MLDLLENLLSGSKFWKCNGFCDDFFLNYKVCEKKDYKGATFTITVYLHAWKIQVT